MLQRPLGIVTQQHQLLRERLRAAEPDIDERTLDDTLEGLTDLHEILATIVRAALVDESLVRGLKDRIVMMEGRLARLQERADKLREIARDAMVETQIKKITMPDFTISVRAGIPALVVVDEKCIPKDYYVPRDPRLNRQALLADLKSGRSVAGVALSNPTPTLSVRVK